MHKPRPIRHSALNNSGFTLLELIVVLAGLGILSSLAIPNYMRYLDYAKVDEAKALLNSAAADCLQKLRRKSSTESLVDIKVNDSIISFQRLKSTDYIFKNGSERITNEDYIPSCKSVSITAAREIDRKSRLPDLGFELFDDGTLTKISSDSGSETKFPCQSWAGKYCTEEAALIEWQKLNEAIAKAKGDCEKSFNSFIASGGTGKTKQWDPAKTSKCTTAPPKFEDPETCTASGCTTDVWYLDGEICGYTAEAFEQCRSDKFDRECQEDRNNKKNENATTSTVDGETLPRCGSERFWFFEGEDVGSAGAWSQLKCDQNKKELLSTTHSGPVEHCDISPIYIIGGEEIFPDGSREDAKAEFEKRLADNKDAQCTQALNEDAVGKRGGPHTSPTPNGMTAPVGTDCNIQYWYCPKSGKIYRGSDAEEAYKADEKCKNQKPKPWWCPYKPLHVDCQ